ncbi:hypothetical protein [Thermogemmatispora aurantia]|nr:hypothetical protein [Thermogemmatispora aurantia]
MLEANGTSGTSGSTREHLASGRVDDGHAGWYGKGQGIQTQLCTFV